MFSCPSVVNTVWIGRRGVRQREKKNGNGRKGRHELGQIDSKTGFDKKKKLKSSGWLAPANT